jgi:hypothetical protein
MRSVGRFWQVLLYTQSDWLRAGRSGDRILVEARFSAPVQTSSGAHPAYCTMDTGSFPGIKNSGRVTLTPHLLLMPWSRKGRATPLLPLWAVRPVQSHSACTIKVHFTLPYCTHSYYWTLNTDPENVFDLTVMNVKLQISCTKHTSL